jgi:hypothetical protein
MLRAGLAAAMLVGIITNRRIIGVPSWLPPTQTPSSTIGPAIQQLLGSDQRAAAQSMAG